MLNGSHIILGVSALIFIHIFHCGGSVSVFPSLGGDWTGLLRRPWCACLHTLHKSVYTDTVYSRGMGPPSLKRHCPIPPPLRKPSTQKRVKHTAKDKGRCIDVRHTTLMVVSIVDILPRAAWLTHLGGRCQRDSVPPPPTLLYAPLFCIDTSSLSFVHVGAFVGESGPS